MNYWPPSRPFWIQPPPLQGEGGGRLVYSTCTIDPAENEEQVRAFVGRHPEFRVVTPDVRFPAGMTVGDWGALSVPTRTGMDGFFLCAMQKRDS